MAKRIVVLTQPLHTNYGGTLQAYALQKVLKDMSFDVETLNYRSKSVSDFIKFLSILKQFLGGTKKYQFTSREMQVIQLLHNKFIEKNLTISEEMNSLEELKKYFDQN